jgi:hypothetical protein
MKDEVGSFQFSALARPSPSISPPSPESEPILCIIIASIKYL